MSRMWRWSGAYWTLGRLPQMIGLGKNQVIDEMVKEWEDEPERPNLSGLPQADLKPDIEKEALDTFHWKRSDD